LMLVVLDTNVIVSGLLKDTGNPKKIMDLVVGSQIRLAYDNRILGEYEDVLARPELQISQPQANALITYIELTGYFVDEAKPFPAEGVPDKHDLPFMEVFLTSGAQALVTGNLRHFLPLAETGLPIISPAQFIEKFFSNL
jgi:uncharacterized protein